MATAKNSAGLLTASSNIARIDVVLEMSDVISGPSRGKAPLCLGCLSTGDKTVLKGCSLCSWPVCCTECETVGLHAKECAILAKGGWKSEIMDYNTVSGELDFVAPLRMVLKLEEDKALKERLGKLVNVEETMKRNINVYGKESDNNIIETITKKVKHAADKTAIQLAIAIIENLSMPQGSGSIGVYEELGHVSHSCSPNTYHACQANRKLVVKAATALEKGELVTLCRVDMTKCNLYRRRLLRQALISCECKRCCDGTEFGSGFGSVVCPDCKANVSPTSEDENADWLCGGCKEKKPAKNCIAVLEKLNMELEVALKKGETNHPKRYERMLLGEGDWAKVPASSQLFLDIRHRLIFMYQYHADYYFADTEVDQEYLKVKLGHIEPWLQMRDKLFPGLSYPWVMIMYEKLSASVALLCAQKMCGAPIAETNAFIGEIMKIPVEPVEMTVSDEDPSLSNAFRQSLQIAVEAREMQKTRVLLSAFADDVDDDDYWAGYT